MGFRGPGGCETGSNIESSVTFQIKFKSPTIGDMRFMPDSSDIMCETASLWFGISNVNLKQCCDSLCLALSIDE